MNKIRVGVLMGGKSIEKEVSFNSGRTICDHLDTKKYEIIPIFQKSTGELYLLPWRFLHRGKISDFEHRLRGEARELIWDDLKQLVDFIYIAQHGQFAEDGTLQGFLEVLGIPYLGSKVFASALGMDKVIQKKILQANGILTPRSLNITPQMLSDFVKNSKELISLLTQKKLNFPLIVKPSAEGSSLGISVVKNEDQLINALVVADTNCTKSQTIMLEEFITGMEFTCIIITDYKNNKLIALPPTEIIPETGTDFFDYDQKYMPGRATKFTPARCSEEIQEKIKATCIKSMQALEMTNLARIDGFVTQDGSIVIIDPNSLSGMAPSSFLFRQAAEIEMSHTKLINHLIETELATKNINVTGETMENGANTSKVRVAVLLGGRSHEKEISLESGRNVFYKLSPDKYEPVAIFVDNNLRIFKLSQSLLVRHSTHEITLGLDQASEIKWSQLPQFADFVFIGLHGGEGENGCIQGTLEMLGLPYNGSSVLTSSLCMDKFKTTQFLKSQGFDVPTGVLVNKADWEKSQEEVITKIKELVSYPLIIKPHDDGCSVLVAKARTDEQLIMAINAIFADGKNHALVEECITGMELTVGVIGNDDVRALPPSQTVVASDILSIEEKFLPGAGENQTPAPLADDKLALVKKTMEAVYKALNCKGYVRIDCFYQADTDRVIIIEINTLPGLTPATCIFHQAAEIGIKPMDFIDLIVQLGFEEHGKVKIISPTVDMLETIF